MVRLYRLRLFRRGHRASILPRGRPDFLAARRVRRLCRGLSDAALWQSGVWPYRRQDGAQSRADGIGHPDGGADIPDRTSADLPADWHYGTGAAGVAATPAGTLGGPRQPPFSTRRRSTGGDGGSLSYSGSAWAFPGSTSAVTCSMRQYRKGEGPR